MAGRPPKPKELLMLTGADKRNPARFRKREGEPTPPPKPLEYPAYWRIEEPQFGYQRAAKLRAIWDECLEMWPWLTYSDSVTLERICPKLLAERNAMLNGCSITAAEQRILSELLTSVGANGVGRARLGQQVAPKSDAAAKDPRAAYMERKVG